MTLETVLNRVKILRPHSYPEGELRAWLHELEQMLYEEIIRPRCPEAQPPQALTQETPGEHVLTAPDPYGELYIFYLMAQIDLHRAEAERYSLDAALFHAAYYQYAHAYARRHLPRGKVKVTL